MKDRLPFTQTMGLFCLVVLYGVLGSPTPDQLGWVELGVLMSLIMSIGLVQFSHALLHWNKATPLTPLFWLFLLFVWGSVTSISVALIHGNNFGWIIRDYASFLLLCLPLFYRADLSHRSFCTSIALAIFSIGLIFSMRVSWGLYMGHVDTGDIGLLYLSISPEILFTACATSMFGGYILFFSDTIRLSYKILLFFIAFLCACLSTYVLYTSSMRAGVGAVIASVMIMGIWGLIYCPKRVIIPAVIALLLITIFYGFFIDVLTPLLEKQKSFGLNQRLEEFSAVSQEMDGSTLSHIIGLGWGAGIESPSSAGLYVNFTHNLFLALWLKTGWIGILLMSAFCISTVRMIFHSIKMRAPYDVMMVIALLTCVSINMLLYGGYKSLGFGLCLTLLFSLCFSTPRRKSDDTSIMIVE